MNKISTLVFTETRNDEIEMETKIDVTDMTTTCFVEKIYDIMKLHGYHEISIWRAFKEISEEKIEYFNSIISSEEEWAEVD